MPANMITIKRLLQLELDVTTTSKDDTDPRFGQLRTIIDECTWRDGGKATSVPDGLYVWNITKVIDSRYLTAKWGLKIPDPKLGQYAVYVVVVSHAEMKRVYVNNRMHVVSESFLCGLKLENTKITDAILENLQLSVLNSLVDVSEADQLKYLKQMTTQRYATVEEFFVKKAVDPVLFVQAVWKTKNRGSVPWIIRNMNFKATPEEARKWLTPPSLLSLIRPLGLMQYRQTVVWAGSMVKDFLDTEDARVQEFVCVALMDPVLRKYVLNAVVTAGMPMNIFDMRTHPLSLSELNHLKVMYEAEEIHPLQKPIITKLKNYRKLLMESYSWYDRKEGYVPLPAGAYIWDVSNVYRCAGMAEIFGWSTMITHTIVEVGDGTIAVDGKTHYVWRDFAAGLQLTLIKGTTLDGVRLPPGNYLWKSSLPPGDFLSKSVTAPISAFELVNEIHGVYFTVGAHGEFWYNNLVLPERNVHDAILVTPINSSREIEALGRVLDGKLDDAELGNSILAQHIRKTFTNVEAAFDWLIASPRGKMPAAVFYV
jgi:hypothetical protein